MAKHVLINGCSHTAGSEIEGSGIGESRYNRENCFGAQLAKKLNLTYTNLALPGGSNDYISRSTIFWCLNNPTLIKDTIFLINWTGSNRTEFFVDDTIDNGFWQDYVYDEKVGHVHFEHVWPGFTKTDKNKLIKASKIIFQYETHWEINRYMNIINLQTILKNYRAKFIFRNGFDYCKIGKRFENYQSLIDTETFRYFDNQKESFFENCLNAGHSVEGQQYWHHKLDAHTYWANKLYQEEFN